jgi:4-aminobutyrate aminotransferase-like enzyme
MDSLRKLASELTNGMKAFMLELVNTSYGFELRSSFLRRLRDLMDSFQARLCVDEVMTAGRTSDTFLLSDYFQLRAEYVSLGKFMTQGVVLERLGVNPQDFDKRRVNGISLGTSLIRMELVLREVSSFKKGTVEDARARMINHLQSIRKQPGDSHQQVFGVWGRGAILFCNVWCDRSGVVIGRYLPLMGTPLPPIDTSRSTMWDARDKKNEKIEPQMLKDYLKVLKRMWSFCSKS